MLVCKIDSRSQFFAGNILVFKSTGYEASEKYKVGGSWGGVHDGPIWLLDYFV